MKNLLNRVAGGFVIGVIIGQIVQIIISFSVGQGEYMPVVEQFHSYFHNGATAVFVQNLLTGLIGITFATSSLVFDVAKWGLLKQYFIHFCITAAVWIPIVMLLWMPQTSRNVLVFLLSFLGTYIITWVTQYVISKNDIKQINAAIQLKRLEEGGEE
ncbi:DUF3021 domain-containing protein [Paenibacillus popilliae]|uniref:DUF3021 domain-containing protein n=1 Tax=Paenibacillus popilliae TaxID=78057 RepID=A0ABY3AJG0_PAEPP|nr:DUF3021 domain-containing protein [Paenibacillus sp. SDF0028]TQR42622.1 DUF3021 domain-containing protein [Paenibacillus sp. SDF0028]